MSDTTGTFWHLRHAASDIGALMVRHACVQSLAKLPGSTDQLVMAAAGAWQRMVPASRRARFRAAQSHLQALGIAESDCTRLAARHVALELLRDIRFQRYEIDRPIPWRKRIRAQELIDPQQYWQPTSPGGLVALLHTGEYRLSVTRIIEAHDTPTRFVVPALFQPGDLMHRTLQSLEQFGHSVEAVHPSAPNLALILLRRLRAGYTVISFVDLPAAVGQQRFADPVHCRFLGAPALMALAPLQLAVTAGVPVLLAGARFGKDCDGLHLLARYPSLEGEGAIGQLLDVASDFIRDDPANWFLLDRLDSYRHMRDGVRDIGRNVEATPG